MSGATRICQAVGHSEVENLTQWRQCSVGKCRYETAYCTTHGGEERALAEMEAHIKNEHRKTVDILENHSHFVNVCSCGVVIAQCQCIIRNKAKTVTANGCFKCRAKESLMGIPKSDMPVHSMLFGSALQEATSGRKIQRAGWNDKNVWICYMPPVTIPDGMVNGRTKAFVPTGDLKVGGYFVMYTVDGTWQPGWLASQADMLANDWQTVD